MMDNMHDSDTRPVAMHQLAAIITIYIVPILRGENLLVGYCPWAGDHR